MTMLSFSDQTTIDSWGNAMTLLSLIGNLVILIIWVYHRQLRSILSMKLIACMAACDFLAGIFEFVQPTPSEIREMMIGTIPVSSMCQWQGLGLNFFELATVLWTSSISVGLWLILHYKMTEDGSLVALVAFSLVCLGLPLVLSLTAFYDNAYGPAGSWCWVMSDRSTWRLVAFYAPLWLSWAGNCAVWVWAWCYFLPRREASTALGGVGGGGVSADSSKYRQLFWRYMDYPYVITRGDGFVGECFRYMALKLVALVERGRMVALSLSLSTFTCPPLCLFL